MGRTVVVEHDGGLSILVKTEVGIPVERATIVLGLLVHPSSGVVGMIELIDVGETRKNVAPVAVESPT